MAIAPLRSMQLKGLCVVVLCLLVWLAGIAQAAIEVQSFDDPHLSERYKGLSQKLRCPMCQNESIAASNSPISADMRERVANMLRDGASNKTIKQTMVQRFGDYVLYKPRLEARTWLLWGLPIGLVALGGVIVTVFVVRRRRHTEETLSDNERQRLEGLTSRHDSTDTHSRDEP
ncbi:cytochrome c-type biogenesis protein CcmH [Chromohalobacter sp. 48-RD10]|uniref:cytochrome c-type biogenesis protein n=1 Tax=Chromohalobacter sp. 48-RD10 TaxID=2994063 RepID=UPI0024690211|nr:cytochrome c-type biogenesis protein CcmH [Chromohalobacter sp. 48-RD10]